MIFEAKRGGTSLLLGLLACSGWAITVGQIDTFTSGTLSSWTSGASLSIQNGGPGGGTDKFLRVISSGNAGPGGHMAAYNPVQWAGDWATEGVKLIECDMNNIGSNAVNMRIILFTASFGRYCSAVSVDLPANSGWRHVYFPVRQADLVNPGNNATETYAELMTSVPQMMLRHNPVPSAQGVSIAATLGIDNVRASAGWKMSGTVTFQDFGGTIPSSVTMEFRNPGTQTVVYEQSAFLSGSGAYSVYSPPVPGAYDVTLKYGHWLRRTIALSSTNADITTDFSLINGDINGDNEIGIGDYSLLSAAYNSFEGDPNWNAEADLNGDGEISIADYAILSSGYGQFGDD